MAQSFDEAAQILPDRLRQPLLQIPPQTKHTVTEIRLRAFAPLLLTTAQEPLFVRAAGQCGSFGGTDVLKPGAQEIRDTFLRACGYSVHAYEMQIREGFLTVPGGHRLGLCGHMDIRADNAPQMLTTITSLNLRIARAIPSASAALCEALFSRGLCSVIVAGPPLSGKTTMLRDLARRLSEGLCGRLYRVSVIDSRGEFAPLPYCDVLSGCDKATGVRMALRALSPQMLLCDEVGTTAEIDAIAQSFSAGAACAVSVHVRDAAALRLRKPVRQLLQTGQFDHVVLLDAASPCAIDTIYDARELCP
ncbi:MAG: hypothetical protein IJT44_04770 [Clostridia bacterium]|nr:hypothetical protein [Clostridia bacterium]